MNRRSGRDVPFGAAVRMVLGVSLLVGGLLGLAGCQRFDAAEPLGQEVKDQFTEFPADIDAFLGWCADEVTGNPDSWGP